MREGAKQRAKENPAETGFSKRSKGEQLPGKAERPNTTVATLPPSPEKASL